MLLAVETLGGAFLVDLDEETAEAWYGTLEPQALDVGLPRLVSAAATGSTVVAALDMRPPLVVSHDAGRTWREAGRGLPEIRAVAVSDDNPDVMVAAARNRLYLSRDGGRFWSALALELPEIQAISF